MSSQNENKNFFDSRTIIAVVLVGALFFGWQKYLEHRYPDYYKKRAENAVATQNPQNAATGIGTNQPAAAATTTANAPTTAQSAVVPGAPGLAETLLPMQVGNLKFDISSKGMGFKNLSLTNYTNREQKPQQLGVSTKHGLYEVGLWERADKVDFKLEKISDSTVKGTAQVGATVIEQTLTFNTNDSFSSQVSVLHADAQFKGLTVLLPEDKHQTADGTFFLPSIEHQEFVVRHQGTLDRVNGSSKKEDVNKDFQQVSMVALGSQYFASAILDKSSIIPEVKLMAPAQGELTASLLYKPAAIADRLDFQWVGYAGPKSLDQMQSADPAFAEIVNYGFFSPIGKVLLIALKWFHSFLGNWGLAIIFLTLIVRALVLPFNITSYKSMKKMQAIQPMLTSLRERYKEDPAALNRETMALMRDQKVNPIGGCLPMLLQMPIFFALYQVLGQSIELYQAPFFGWIHDLSLKDPFFVLPVLMGATMFIQQKITPTTMDPTQAKILQWMPLIFAVFTVSLPAGLTLYIFISTLFGVIQQQMFMRDRKTRASTTAAVAAK